jgi:hypothetical protein
MSATHFLSIAIRLFFPLIVPGQILVAVFAKLRLYEFREGGGVFAELLSILEEQLCRTSF